MAGVGLPYTHGAWTKSYRLITFCSTKVKFVEVVLNITTRR